MSNLAKQELFDLKIVDYFIENFDLYCLYNVVLSFQIFGRFHATGEKIRNLKGSLEFFLSFISKKGL